MKKAFDGFVREFIQETKKYLPFFIVISILSCLLTISVLGNLAALGDINNDGRITTTDLVQLRQIAEGQRRPNRRSDLSGNGITNEYDVQILRIMLSGQ